MGMFDLIYPFTVAFIALSAPLTFYFLQLRPAPYGRFYQRGWGKRVSSKWGWLLMEIPAVVVSTFVYFQGEFADQAASLFLYSLWMFHYLYRSFIYPFYVHRSSNNMSFTVILSAFLFNIINGFNIGYALSSSPLDGFFIVGTIIFIIGFGIHFYSDWLLKKIPPGEYRILDHFLYRYVCAPNYLGEAIQWLGYAIAVWSMATSAFALFTFANLIPRALKSREWYLETFPDFPQKRKAIFPFIL